MSRIGPGYDWGQRSPRWAGITSGVVEVGGTRVHYLRAGDEGGDPAHLLVHPMGTGAWCWMDVIGPLSAHGPVVAPDLPGSGRTRPLHRGSGDIVEYVRFLEAFTTALGMKHSIVHGHSMGGLVGGVFAGRSPHRVERLILTSAPLPGLPDPPPFPAAWRLGLDVARPVADILVGAALRLKADRLRHMVEERDGSRMGPELSRMSSDLTSLAAEEIGRMTLRWRVEGAVDAATAVVRALTVDEARIRDALESITAPTMLLWGAEDRVIPRRLISDVDAAHPDWSSRTIDGVGHLLPWEDPRRYVALAVRPGEGHRSSRSGGLDRPRRATMPT